MSNFMDLSVPAGRIFGINIRIHWLFFPYAIWAVSRYYDSLGLVMAAAVFVGIYLCILLHEFGHSLTARWCGGSSDDILLWPLGGLAYCRVPHNPTPNLLTVAAGPLVTLMIWAILAGIISFLPPPQTRTDASWYILLYLLREINWFLLLFNLIPAFPMDGGQILRNILWHFLPYSKSTRAALIVGFAASGGFLLWGLIANIPLLPFVAIMNLMTCWQLWQNLSTSEDWRYDHWTFADRLAASPGIFGRSRQRPSKKPRYEKKLTLKPELIAERHAVIEVDALLEKISRHGIQSLTPEEREALDKASARLRDNG